MPGKFIFLLNAAIFGSLAALGSNAHRSFDANAFSQGPKAAKPSITTKSVTTQPVSPHGLAHSTALLPGAAPKTANLLPSAANDAVVPPIVRRRPAGGPAVAAIEPEKGKKSAKAENPATKGSKVAAVKPPAVKTAAVAPGNNKPIDLSGRSALGAAPKGVKCNTGLKYDAKQLKCVAAGPKPATAVKPATAAKPVVKVVKSAASTEKP